MQKMTLEATTQRSMQALIVHYITLLRIALTPLIAFFFILPFTASLAFILFIIAWISDILDGYLARKYTLISKLGSMLDSYADKVLTIGVLSTLAVFNVLENYILGISALIIIIRELMVFLLKMLCHMENTELKVTRSAKIKSFLEMLSLALLLCPYLKLFTYSLAIFTMPIAAFFAITTAAEYYYHYYLHHYHNHFDIK